MPELNTVTAPPAHIHSARNLFGLGHHLYISS